MNTIISCGDSFTFGIGLAENEKTYGELLAEELGMEHINLGAPGASEFVIFTQVQEAVKMNPSLVLVGHTSEYRWQVYNIDKNNFLGFTVRSILNKIGRRDEEKTALNLIQKHDTYGALALYYNKPIVTNTYWEAMVLRIAKELEGINSIHIGMFDYLNDNFCKMLSNENIIPDIHLDAMRNEFPGTDKFHPNETAHRILKDRLLNEYRKIKG